MSKLTTLWTYLTTPKVFKSRKAIEKIQRKGMAKHVKMVRQNSPFFARHWAGMADEDWREFPLVNKAIMMEHLQDYIDASSGYSTVVKLMTVSGIQNSPL